MSRTRKKKGPRSASEPAASRPPPDVSRPPPDAERLDEARYARLSRGLWVAIVVAIAIGVVGQYVFWQMGIDPR